MDATTWAALAAVLTVLGLVWTWTAFRRRGAAAGLRGLAWTLVPVALWLTGTLRLAGDVAHDVARWAGRLVFSPTTWAGIVVAGTALVLFVVSGWMLGRGVGVKTRGQGGHGSGRRAVRPGSTSPQVAAKPAAPADDSGLDDDVADILRKRGIS